jgi:hypothetical protein
MKYIDCSKHARNTAKYVEHCPPVKVDDKPIPSQWLGIELDSGAEVLVGLQEEHPQTPGRVLLHEMYKTNENGERELFRFCVSEEAAKAMAWMYMEHGLINLNPSHRSCKKIAIINKLLRTNEPWSLLSILGTLSTAARRLLGNYSYEGEDAEAIRLAMKYGSEHVDVITMLMQENYDAVKKAKVDE